VRRAHHGGGANEAFREFEVQLALIDLATAAVTRLGSPGCYESASLSPDASFVATTRTIREGEPDEARRPVRVALEVRSVSGSPTGEAPSIVIEGRAPLVTWDPSHPSRLVWTEVAHGGRPGGDVLALEVPFTGPPSSLLHVDAAIRSLSFSPTGVLFVSEEAAGSPAATWVIARGGSSRRRIFRAGDSLPRR
jgi:hypothetical protein